MLPSPIDRDVDRLLMSAMTFGLPGAVTWSAKQVTEDVFRRSVESAIQQGLLGALGAMAAEDAMPLDSEQLAVLRREHTQSQLHALQLERMMLDVVTRFEGAGIPSLVLKGSALAHLVHDEPAWRTAKDVDLLVPPDRLADAVAIACSDLGGTTRFAELRPGFDREFGKEVLVRLDRLELDLHRTLAGGPFGLTIPLDELYSAPQEFVVGGHRLTALSREAMFLHACISVAIGDEPVRLGPVRDLLLCANRLGLEPDLIIELADRWSLRAVVQHAAQMSRARAGTGPASWLAELSELDVSPRDRWLLNACRGAARSYRRALASLVVIPTWEARVRYLHAIVRPSRRYLESRDWSLGRHISRALRYLGGRA